MSQLGRVRPFLRAASRQFSSDSSVPRGPQAAWIPIGAMKRGPKYFTGSWESQSYNGGVNTWILMPGVSKENVTVKVIDNQIFFHGTEVLDVPDYYLGSRDEIAREYKGSFLVNPARYDPANLKAEIVDGIFWLHVPNKNH